jgi:hypothetical protein
MKGNCLPPEDHIARYCKYTTLSEDGKPSSSAFRLRKEKAEKYLSVQWLEYMKQPNRSSEINEACRLLVAGNFKLRAKALIAVLNVGDMCEHVETQSHSHFKIRVLHEPSSSDHSHSGIHDTIQDELMISELISEKILETYPAVISP